MKRSQSKGFTLIELLVVIAIIGLLSTLAVVALNSARQRSRDAKRVSDIRQIQTALELAFSEGNAYPIEATAVTLGTSPNDVLCAATGAAATFRDDTTTAPACTTTYMGLVPSNPSPNGTAYTYLTPANGASYYITFTLEGATGQLTAATYPAMFCANQNGIQADDATPGC